jgi:hypothetical protein
VEIPRNGDCFFSCVGMSRKKACDILKRELELNLKEISAQLSGEVTSLYLERQIEIKGAEELRDLFFTG